MSKKSRKTKTQTRKAPTPLPTMSSKLPAIVGQDAKKTNEEAYFAVVPVSGTIAYPETSPETRSEALPAPEIEPAVLLNYHLEKRKVILRDLEPLAKLKAEDPVSLTQESRDLHPDGSVQDACSVSGEFFRIGLRSTEEAIAPEDVDLDVPVEDPPEIRRRRSRFRMVIGTVMVGVAALLIVGVARSAQAPRDDENGKTGLSETQSPASHLPASIVR